jgi:uncharacterized lipoprotein YehR (DUF1307 family)
MVDPNNEWLSGDDQAVLDAFDNGGLEAVSAANPESEASIDEVENFMSKVTEDLAGQVANESEESVAEEDSLDGEDESEAEDENGEIESSDGDDEEESELFVDGPRGQKIKVDLKPNRDRIIKLHQAEDRAKQYQSQLDKFKHEASLNEEKIGSLQEDSNLFNQLSDMTDELDYKDPSSFNDIISVLTEGELTFDDLLEKAMEERDFVSDLSDDALALYEERKEIRVQRRELEKAQARKSRDEAKAQSEHQARIETEQKTMIHNAFLKYDVRGQLGDQGRENGIMERAWNESINKLGKYDEVTPELADEIFKSEIEFFRGPLEKAVSQKVDKAVRKRSAQVASKVQKKVKPSGKTTREQIEEMDWDAAFSNLNNFKF